MVYGGFLLSGDAVAQAKESESSQGGAINNFNKKAPQHQGSIPELRQESFSTVSSSYTNDTLVTSMGSLLVDVLLYSRKEPMEALQERVHRRHEVQLKQQQQAADHHSIRISPSTTAVASIIIPTCMESLSSSTQSINSHLMQQQQEKAAINNNHGFPRTRSYAHLCLRREEVRLRKAASGQIMNKADRDSVVEWGYYVDSVEENDGDDSRISSPPLLLAPEEAEAPSSPSKKCTHYRPFLQKEREALATSKDRHNFENR
jgi:hypothetical protein